MKNNKFDILRLILLPITEFFVVVLAFWFAYDLRSITDGIPFVQLKIPHISPEQFSPFVWLGALVWLLVFARARLYSHARNPIFAEIKKVVTYAFFWFFTFIGIVYLTQGFIFSKEIPRLIIFYALFISIALSICIRILFAFLWKYAIKKDLIPKQKILLIHNDSEDEEMFSRQDAEYIKAELHEANRIEAMIRDNRVDAVLLTSGNFSDTKMQGIIQLARIYGIKCAHPQIMPHFQHFSQEEGFLGGVPVFVLSAVAITPWERVGKRLMDIILASIFLIVSLPVMFVIYIAIKIEDPTGPAIYRNRRIGQNGEIFTLFKFRYMYWKYCTKEDYLKDGERDEAMELEEQLKQKNNGRTGPIYKIQNDPRKMKFGKIIEKFSLDELPQLFNVLMGNMSLVGPRPHQPREVALYDESDKQVLTIKPGITGMAQVYGRDKNSFKKEIAHDIYYIENYSILLDLLIIIRTIFVVLLRPFEKFFSK